jgi:hypothetical protein
MDAADKPDVGAWQPLTFGGVAAFARAGIGRLLGMALSVAAVVAVAGVFLVEVSWTPCLHEAIAKLPREAAISRGRLQWPSLEPARLSSQPSLSIVVDPGDRREFGSASDLQFELGAGELRLRSMFGSVRTPYPEQLSINLSRSEVEPWWGAWHPIILVFVGLATILVLLMAWMVLGAVYCWFVLAIASMTGRVASLTGCWKLSVAALMPGALLMSGAIAAYALQQINLVQLLFAQAAHLLLGWLMLLGAAFRLPPKGGFKPPRRTRNPFHSSSTSGDDD